MTVARVRVNGAEQIIAMLGQLAQRSRDLRPALRDIGAQLRSEAVDSFKGQRSPEGEPWRPLSMAARLARVRKQYRAKGGIYTKNRKRTRAGVLGAIGSAQALLNTGALRNSIQVRTVTPTSVSVGTNLDYAAIHQFGGMAGRNRKVRIPARPFMGLSEKGRASIVDTLRAYLLQEAA